MLDLPITGSTVFSQDSNQDSHFVVYPFDKYEIKIKVDSNEKFIGVEEISINKNFINYKQQISSPGYHDVSQFYAE